MREREKKGERLEERRNKTEKEERRNEYKSKNHYVYFKIRSISTSHTLPHPLTH